MLRQNKNKFEETFLKSMDMESDDACIIEQFQRGDEAVFNQLVHRYQTRTYQLAQRYVPNVEDAQDITQDAFVRAYQGLANFKRQSQFYSWLYRITINLCIDFLRKNARRKMVTQELHLADISMMSLADPNLTSPSGEVENKELLSHLRSAIRQLPPKQQEIFVLRYWEGLALKDIADALGKSCGTIKAHLFHAHRNLRKYLRHYVQDSDVVMWETKNFSRRQG